MKPSKMLELVENLKVGEKVIIEKFKDHLFVEKFPSKPGEWIPAPSDNINVHGVDLSILNEEDWFYVVTPDDDAWIAKGNIVKAVSESCIHYSIDGSLYTDGMLCYRNSITLLRKATDSDLAPFFEKYPQYAPVKVGDIGLFFDSSKHIKDDRYTIGRLAKIRKGQIYEYEEKYATWKHFFKVSESETIAEIKERFLREVEIVKSSDGWNVWNKNGLIYCDGIWVERLEEKELEKITIQEAIKENADEYILRNKKVFSYEDFIRWGNVPYERVIMQLAKERVEQ